MSRVLIEPADYQNCRKAVDKAMETFPLEISGKKVLIKPNALRASQPEEGIVTNPAVLSAVVKAVEEMKPKSIIVGDNPGLFDYGYNEQCFKQTGLMEAAEGYYQNIGNNSKNLNFNSSLLPYIGVSQAVIEAEIIISLPKFKTHGLTVITGAIKNSYGILPGALKAKLHEKAGNPERFHEVVVEVFKIRIPDLFIMDAVVGMEGNGPASPDLRDIGRIICSNDAVALDAVVAKMMGLEPGRLRFLQKAKEMGLGDYDLETIEVIGNLQRLSFFKVPPLGGEAVLDNEAIRTLIQNKSQVKPEADPNLCTGCGECVEHCPVSALSLYDSQVPVVDSDICITCFCCQEICPEKAMTLK